MIVILKLAFCLRAIGVRTCGKTTVGIPEGKKEDLGVLRPIQRFAMKFVIFLSVQKVKWYHLSLLFWKQVHNITWALKLQQIIFQQE